MPVHAIAGLADIADTEGFVLAPGVKLSSPKDLKGKKLAYTNGNPQVLILAKLAKIHGFDSAAYRTVSFLNSTGLRCGPNSSKSAGDSDANRPLGETRESDIVPLPFRREHGRVSQPLTPKVAASDNRT
jgi:hypothetical protein